MDIIQKALKNLGRSLETPDPYAPVPIQEYFRLMCQDPYSVIRNIFQVFHDMIRHHLGEGVDEYPGDPESIHFVHYDTSKLFEEELDHPFFADRLFTNRLLNLAENMRRGAQQNKIYMFEGPPGCGKSTFLNNLLLKFEAYANSEAGRRYEVVWRLDRLALGGIQEKDIYPLFERHFQQLEPVQSTYPAPLKDLVSPLLVDSHIEIPCPSHDHPLLMIPKGLRRAFLDDLFHNNEFKWKLFTDKEYEWVFRENPCTICTALYHALQERFKSADKVFDMLYARIFRINRRLGEGVSVFNPGDRPLHDPVISNPMLQSRVDGMFRDSNQVKVVHSRYARINNGIYALMDIKNHNVDRLIELHNIISEGVHKVEDIEENVNALFIALLNPEDKQPIEKIRSFSDRIQGIQIPYVLDLNTEVKIYRSIFGRHIEHSFLPRVLHNFARIIISTRLAARSEAMQEWIGDSRKYMLYCDERLHLLKMEIYTGHIPVWLDDEDRKRFTADRRRRIIAESEQDGQKGLSGRDAIKIFSEFYSAFAREDRLITMANLTHFFTKIRRDLTDAIPAGFLESLVHLYDYTVLQEVKECLYDYNEQQIARDIQNYLFAINFEPKLEVLCKYTGDRLEITEELMRGYENRILGADITEKHRLQFRQDTQRSYTARALTQEMMIEGKPLTGTTLFREIQDRYIHNLKERVLEPFLQNENFRNAIRDYESEGFKTYDRRIQEDVSFLMNNLGTRRHYTQQGAREVCIYVIDRDLAKAFSQR